MRSVLRRLSEDEPIQNETMVLKLAITEPMSRLRLLESPLIKARINAAVNPAPVRSDTAMVPQLIMVDKGLVSVGSGGPGGNGSLKGGRMGGPTGGVELSLISYFLLLCD